MEEDSLVLRSLLQQYIRMIGLGFREPVAYLPSRTSKENKNSLDFESRFSIERAKFYKMFVLLPLIPTTSL